MEEKTGIGREKEDWLQEEEGHPAATAAAGIKLVDAGSPNGQLRTRLLRRQKPDPTLNRPKQQVKTKATSGSCASSEFIEWTGHNRTKYETTLGLFQVHQGYHRFSVNSIKFQLGKRQISDRFSHPLLEHECQCGR